MRPPPPIFQVGHLERMPLGTPYPGIIAHVGRLLAKLPAGTELIIDFTGVGRPVFDMFVYSGISPLGVLITGGTAETSDGATRSVPNRHQPLAKSLGSDVLDQPKINMLAPAATPNAA